jgi:ribosomal protein S18 acetylase RimI-like enzyme
MMKIDEYWASFFGLSVTDFMKSKAKVVPHAQLQGYQGAWLFRRGASFVISAPPDLVEKIKKEVQHPSETTLADQTFVALFGDRVDKVIGPAYQGYLEEPDFLSVASSARLLSSADDNALHELAADCDVEDWEHSDIQIGQHSNFGIFVGSRLVAVANYQVQEETVAMPGIITHPAYRGQGFGKAVLSAAIEHGLSNGFLMLYQTRVANRPALTAAESLGYKQYATHLAVRLR